MTNEILSLKLSPYLVFLELVRSICRDLFLARAFDKLSKWKHKNDCFPDISYMFQRLMFQ